MAFEHHPGLAALHHAIVGNNVFVDAGKSVEQEREEKRELEEITKELTEDTKLNRPSWKGFGS